MTFGFVCKHLCALNSFNKNPHASVGEIQHLMNLGDYADFRKVVGVYVLRGNVILIAEEKQLICVHCFFYRSDRLRTRNVKVYNHSRKDRNSAHRQKGQSVVGFSHIFQSFLSDFMLKEYNYSQIQFIIFLLYY